MLFIQKSVKHNSSDIICESNNVCSDNNLWLNKIVLISGLIILNKFILDTSVLFTCFNAAQKECMSLLISNIFCGQTAYIPLSGFNADESFFNVSGRRKLSGSNMSISF